MPTDLHVPIAKPARPIGEERSSQFTMAKAEPFGGNTQRGRIRGDRVLENIRQRNCKAFGYVRI